MIYFIFSILFIIIGIVIYFLFLIKKINKMKIKADSKINKVSDAHIMEDLRYLRAQLLKVEDPQQRIEIIKKIELITSIYN